MTVIFCLPGKYYSGPFLVAFSDCVYRIQSAGHSVFISQKYSPNLYHVRNLCAGASGNAKDQKPFGGADYDMMIWIDSDIIFTPEQVFRLIESPEPIYSGLYFDIQGRVVVSNLIEDWETKSFAAEWAGMGFCKIAAGVLEAVGFPWFAPIISEDGGESIVEGDDISFFHKAKAKGFQLVVDGRLIVRHEKLTLI